MTAARTLTAADVEAAREVWLVIEREPWEAPRVASIHASKAGAWREAYRRRYALAVEMREDALRGHEPYDRVAVAIEPRNLLP